MDKNDKVENDISIVDALLRIKTLENVLISKGVITKDEYYKEMEEVVKIISVSILQKANVQGDLNEIIDGFKKDFAALKGNQN